MFASLAQTLSRLMLLRAGPQDLPSAPMVMQLAIAAYLLSASARLILVNPPLAAFGQAFLSLAVLWAYLRVILNARKKPERFEQSLSALLLTSAVIGALMLGPLSALTPVLMQVAEGAEMNSINVPSMAAYAWLALSIWGLVLAGHIFRNALDTSLGIGLFAALGYEVLLILVVSLLAIPGS